MAKSFLGEAIQPPVPFNSPLPSIKPSCSIPQNGGVIFLQLSCHILENVNERVCKIKFMGCQWRIRTRRAITYLLSSWSLWYVKQKSMQLNAGISIVLHFTMDVGQCLFSPFFLPPAFSPFFFPSFCLQQWWNEDDYRPLRLYIKKKANESVKGTSQFHNLVPLKPCVIHLQVSDYECLYFSTYTSIQGAMWHCCLIPRYICMHMHLC